MTAQPSSVVLSGNYNTLTMDDPAGWDSLPASRAGHEVNRGREDHIRILGEQLHLRQRRPLREGEYPPAYRAPPLGVGSHVVEVAVRAPLSLGLSE